MSFIIWAIILGTTVKTIVTGARNNNQTVMVAGFCSFMFSMTVMLTA